ncbi:YjcZ family sporulation protein [Turicibacter sp. TJ11]
MLDEVVNMFGCSNNNFAFILVLFILLVIIGCVCGR